ncbi:uncharacterized protein LOC123896885 [Trifolium pratense]|uniref:uncharacterized protein LOC123896885 n=1 Tax=Trifolium pratense TaxID=57577 RepID=UPI001E693315|nr:uncharacterized protein LOC123896885 [Trifolium pratense]
MAFVEPMERMSSFGSAASRLSVSQKVVDEESENHEFVSVAGDIGARVLQGGRKSTTESGGFRLSIDHIKPENGSLYKPQEEYELQQPDNNFIVNSQEQFPTLVATNNKVHSKDIKQVQESDKKLPKLLNYVSCLTHLAVFGILGVLTRYLLQRLFGPGGVGLTSDHTVVYLDLPSNMIGSFFMGWFGVVFKEDISRVSEHLAIALTTGYLGSLTTFSGWNQKMLELCVAGHWILSLLGFLIGMFLVAFSIIFGVETAKGFKWLLKRLKKRHENDTSISKINWKVDSFLRRLVVTIVLLVILVLLWVVSIVLEINEFKNGGGEAQLWLACMIGPLGVWLRWFLASLNEIGIGGGFLKWFPFGTLFANVSASCIMAALATLKKSMNTTNSDTVITGFQFGLLGCLSTVSTFAAEFNVMRESKHPWRAYAYVMVTICISFSFGILLYNIPISRM